MRSLTAEDMAQLLVRNLEPEIVAQLATRNTRHIERAGVHCLNPFMPSRA